MFEGFPRTQKSTLQPPIFSMAQATRTARKTAKYSDDPLENLATWLQVNAKPVGIAVGAVAVVVAAVFMYRTTQLNKRENASTALYAAQGPLSQGNFDEAKTQLGRVVQRYGSTPAGQQAALLLAQVHYEQGQYAEGIASLEAARGSASAEFRPSFEALIAAGHEAAGNFDAAAEQYGRAASSARMESDRIRYEAAQARAYMSGGLMDQALPIWTRLSQLEGDPIAQEARIRMGEILGSRTATANQ